MMMQFLAWYWVPWENKADMVPAYGLVHVAQSSIILIHPLWFLTLFTYVYITVPLLS